MLSSGLVAIEDIQTGDKVISTNTDTFEVAEKTVVQTFIRENTELVHLTINGEVIKTTPEHPFYVKAQGFVNACELKIGDELLDTEQNMLIVEDIYFEICEEPVTVYNFEVKDFHTYHVGQNNVLVHNADYITDNRVPMDKETVLSDKSQYTRTNYMSGGKSKVYIDKNGNYVYRDTLHTGKSSHLEVFNKQGKHLGEADPITGIIKPNTADPTKTVKW